MVGWARSGLADWLQCCLASARGLDWRAGLGIFCTRAADPKLQQLRQAQTVLQAQLQLSVRCALHSSSADRQAAIRTPDKMQIQTGESQKSWYSAEPTKRCICCPS